MLKNLIDNTPVIPVFIAEKVAGDKDEYTPVNRSVAPFPTICHARSKNGMDMLEYLQYVYWIYINLFGMSKSYLRNQVPTSQLQFMSDIKSTMEAVSFTCSNSKASHF